jgi:Ca2+-transporting ATPase
MSWHVLHHDEVLRFWESAAVDGLDAAIAVRRRREFGLNVLPTPQSRSALDVFTDQFKSLPVALLGASAGLSLVTGGFADAAVILAVVLINASIGYQTESQAERTISNLTRRIQPTALVVHHGVEAAYPAAHLVPGDVIVLKRGMYVPADARLLSTEDLSVDESALTGESVPVTKSAMTLEDGQTPLANRTNMVHSGAVVTGGSGRAVVVRTGRSTEVGQIQRLLNETPRLETPLQRQLHLLGRQMVVLSMTVCGGVFAIGLLRGNGLLPMLKTSVSLAVAAVPEGLPTVATMTLALGLRRLEAQHVLVRKLNAVETLGALQDICLDKTGTITLNRMTLVAVFANMQQYHIRDQRVFSRADGLAAVETPEVDQLLRLTVLCSEVEYEQGSGPPQLQGTPTETALVQAALDAGIDLDALRAQYPLARMRLRTEQRNFMETLHHDGDDPLLVVKGNPTEVLAMCNRHMHKREIEPLLEADHAFIVTENERMAGRALRVLGVAYGVEDVLPEQACNLIWMGLVGLPTRRAQAWQT